METLKAYFSSIDPRLFNHVSGKPREFIDIFRTQVYLSEEAFATKLCGENYNEGQYRDWKSRTLKILQAFAIMSENKGSSLIKKKYENCQKKFLLGQKFINQNQRPEGLRLIKQAYKIAEAYDFSYLASELTTILYHNYVYYQRNKKRAKYYAEKSLEYLNNYVAEKNAIICFWDIVLEQIHTSISIDFLNLAHKKVNKIKGESVQYKVYKGMTAVLYNLHAGQYKQLINICNSTLASFNNHLGVYRSQYLFFIRSRGTAQMAIGQYAKATKSFEEAEPYAKPKPYNNYTLQFYKTLNALHAGNYQLAYDLYQKNKRCRIETIRQHFAIVEAYLCFLSHADYLHIDKAFRISKYLNDTFKAQADKKGDNINIVIAQLIIYLVRDKGRYIDYIETVQNYSYRHLKDEDTNRAKWFLKILCLLAHPRVGFHPMALKRKAKKYIELLKNHPIRMGGNFTVEIIPYDVLLNMILSKTIGKTVSIA